MARWSLLLLLSLLLSFSPQSLSTEAAATEAEAETAETETTEEEEWDYELEHSLDGGVEYEKRNGFRIRVVDLDSGRSKVEFAPYKLSEQQVAQLEALSQTGGSYVLRTNVREGAGKPAYVTAHVPACALVSSNFVENIIFHVDSADRLVSFEYANEACLSDPSASSVSASKKKRKLKSRGVLSSLNSVKLPVAIDGNIFYNGGKAGAAVAQAGAATGSGSGQAAAQAEPTFFQKYKWYLIIGVIGYVVVSALNNPELKAQMEQAQRQQQGK